MPRIVGVVDYGAGNLFSVQRGLRAADCRAEFVADPDRLREMDALLLPGVGAFGAGMKMLRESGMDEAVVAFVQTGNPLLGICLGMQFLMSASFEFGEHRGLGLVPGTVVQIDHMAGWPVPNNGWCAVKFSRSPADTPFAGARDGDDFYFAHSFHCVPADARDVLATIDYGGRPIVAMVSRGNVYGCQFHPEMSEQTGLDIYRALQRLA